MNPAAKAYADATIDINTIDRHITTVQDDYTNHKVRCYGRCWRYRSDSAALDVLFDLRLQFMDRRDTAEAEIAYLMVGP